MRRIRTDSRPGWGAAALTAAWLISCSSSGPREASAPGEVGAAPELEVATTSVRRGTIEHSMSAPATLEARRESRIGPEVQGTLLHVFVDEGDLAGAQRRQVEADLARARALRSRGIVAAQDIEKLETAAAVARASERQAAEALALARHRLKQTLMRAPYSGSVAARLADGGTTALVQPQTIVLVLQENSVLEARAAIPESQLFLVRPGDPARIRLEGLATPIETAVAAVGDAIDPATRTYSVRMRVANPDRTLKAGVFAQVEIEPGALRDVLLVPRDALRSEDGGSRVYTVEGGVVTSVPVTLGAISEQAVEILEGPAVGTPVIVGAAAAQVAPGMHVRALEREEPGA